MDAARYGIMSLRHARAADHRKNRQRVAIGAGQFALDGDYHGGSHRLGPEHWDPRSGFARAVMERQRGRRDVAEGTDFDPFDPRGGSR